MYFWFLSLLFNVIVAVFVNILQIKMPFQGDKFYNSKEKRKHIFSILKALFHPTLVIV